MGLAEIPCTLICSKVPSVLKIIGKNTSRIHFNVHIFLSILFTFSIFSYPSSLLLFQRSLMKGWSRSLTSGSCAVGLMFKSPSSSSKWSRGR